MLIFLFVLELYASERDKDNSSTNKNNNFKLLSQAVLEKILKYITFLNPRPPAAGPFGPQGHHLNKLGRGPLGNATYQISRPYA